MENFKNVWKILNENRLEIESQILDFSECTICGHSLVDAYIGVCGCNYCKRCIESWMTLGNQFCPGNSTSCKSEVQLSIHRSVLKDYGSDIRLLAVEIKCPRDSCNHRCKISQLDKHLELCNKSMIECPFNQIGCDFQSINKELLIEHLHSEIEFHSKLCIKYLESKSEKSSLDSDSNEIATGNIWNDLILSIDLKFNELNSINEYQKNQDKVEMEELQNHIQGMRTKYKELRDLIEEIKENWNNKISKLKTENKVLEKEISKLKNLLDLTSKQTSNFDILNKPLLKEKKDNSYYWEFSFNWNPNEMTPTRSHPCYSVDNKYIILIFIFPQGCFFDCYRKNGVCLQFEIAENKSHCIKWEFKGTIKITVINKDLPAESVIVTRNCEFTENFNSQIFHLNRSFRNLFQNLKLSKSLLINCTLELMK